MILIVLGRIDTNGNTSLCSRVLLNALHHENNSPIVPVVGVIGEARDTLVGTVEGWRPSLILDTSFVL